jgi:hypothetical protein
MQGNQPARLLHYSYLPLAMTTVLNRKLLLECPLNDPDRIYSVENPFAEAQQTMGRGWGSRRMTRVWAGNFFPDMRAWDKLNNGGGRTGAEAQSSRERPNRSVGGGSVMMRFPGSELSSHMSVIPVGLYKGAHRHGPGRIIVIPEGDGYSCLWYQDGEKQIVHWTESTAFVPPDQWFHQHFNLGEVPARYLALHPAPQLNGYSENVTNRGDVIGFPDEDPFLRRYFEDELAKRGRKSLMPEEAYTDYGYVFQQASYLTAAS